MTSNVFEQLAQGLSVTQAAHVRRWWCGLSAAERRELARLCGGGSPGEARPVVGRFVRARDGEGAPAPIPNVDFYEYLVNHELSLDDGRTYHICSAHPEARAAVVSGEIRATFACPLANAACPMRALLAEAPGCDLRLSIAVRAPRAGGGVAHE
jgi:hypothetical protein